MWQIEEGKEEREEMEEKEEEGHLMMKGEEQCYHDGTFLMREREREVEWGRSRGEMEGEWTLGCQWIHE